MTIKQALREVVLSKMTLEDKITTILNVVTEGIPKGDKLYMMFLSAETKALDRKEMLDMFIEAIKKELGGE